MAQAHATLRVLPDALTNRGDRARWAWAIGPALVAATVLAALEAHGHDSRGAFAPPLELRGRRVLAVGTAADAFALWDAMAVRGRRVVVLTATWAKPRKPSEHPPLTTDDTSGGATPALEAGTALYAAARLGIARRLDVVMPPAALERRRAELGARKEITGEGLAFSARYEALERRFSPPEAFIAPAEPVLVLVEASFFAEGAPPDPLRWLASTGVDSDLVLLALDDPGATDARRAAARAYASALAIPIVENAL